MTNTFPGLTHQVPIVEWARRPHGTEEYRKVIDLLVEHGHSFAVYDGNLYLSTSAVQRLIDAKMIDPQTMGEEL